MIVGMYYRCGRGVFMMLAEGQHVYGVTPGGQREWLGPLSTLDVLKKQLGAWEAGT